MKKLALVIERNNDGKYFGRVKFGGNLIVEEAYSVDSLEKKMKTVLQSFHSLKPGDVEFDVAYDLGTLFEQNNFLNISAIAKMANMNSSLMRQYASGIKFPSSDKASEIENVIRNIGKDLANVKIASKSGRNNKKAVAKKAVRKKSS